MDAKTLARIGIRSRDRPARSESLYRLSYPGPLFYTRRHKRISLVQHIGSGKGKGKVHPRTGHEGPEGE
jgi:hypothetical protein